MKMWIEYYKERVGGEVIHEDGVGFIAYRIAGYECFIDEAFIAPEYRRKKEASALLEQVEEIAREAGCDHLGANVFLNTLSAKTSVAACLGTGFHIVEGHGKVLAFRKEL